MEEDKGMAASPRSPSARKPGYSMGHPNYRYRPRSEAQKKAASDRVLKAIAEDNAALPAVLEREAAKLKKALERYEAQFAEISHKRKIAATRYAAVTRLLAFYQQTPNASEASAPKAPHTNPPIDLPVLKFREGEG